MTTPLCPVCGLPNAGSRYHPYCGAPCQRKAHPPRMTPPIVKAQQPPERQRKHGKDNRD